MAEKQLPNGSDIRLRVLTVEFVQIQLVENFGVRDVGARSNVSIASLFVVISDAVHVDGRFDSAAGGCAGQQSHPAAADTAEIGEDLASLGYFCGASIGTQYSSFPSARH